MDRVTPTHVCLLLSNHDGCPEMDMDDHEQLLVTRLEEQMFDVSKQYVCPDMISRSRCISSRWQPTDFLGAHRRLVSQTGLVNLDLARQSFSVESRPHKYFGELVRSPTFELYQDVLLNDVGHLLLLLFPLIDLFLQICNLFRDLIKAVAV